MPIIINPYLNFRGNCEQAFSYYEQTLGGQVTMMMKHSDNPQGQPPSPEWGSKVLHASLKVAGIELMGSDVPHAEPVRSAYLALNADTSEEAERIFLALSEGGQIIMPIQKTFWAERFGMVRDQFGPLWMVSCNSPLPS